MKKFFKHIILFGLSILASIMVFNYTFDYYSVFDPDFEYLRDNIQLFDSFNVHYFQITSIIEKNDRYDSILFGSSRVGFTDVSKIRGERFYNLWYPASAPLLWHKDLKFLLDKGCKFKKVVLALDDFSYRVNMATFRHGVRKFRHYPYTLQNKIGFYLFHLTLLPNTNQVQQKYQFFRKINADNAELFEHGGWYLKGMEDMIDSEPLKHNTDKKFKVPYREMFRANRMEETIREIRIIKELCDKNNIKLTIYFNPIHRATYLSNSVEEFRGFLAFKRRVSEISPFYDFTGINEIVSNNLNFYETSHYRPLVSDMMLSKMYGLNLAKVPEGFGAYVTAENIDEHLKGQLEQFLYYKEKEVPSKNRKVKKEGKGT
jgi:hypothetical protein